MSAGDRGSGGGGTSGPSSGRSKIPGIIHIPHRRPRPSHWGAACLRLHVQELVAAVAGELNRFFYFRFKLNFVLKQQFLMTQSLTGVMTAVRHCETRFVIFILSSSETFQI